MTEWYYFSLINNFVTSNQNQNYKLDYKIDRGS